MNHHQRRKGSLRSIFLPGSLDMSTDSINSRVGFLFRLLLTKRLRIVDLHEVMPLLLARGFWNKWRQVQPKHLRARNGLQISESTFKAFFNCPCLFW